MGGSSAWSYLTDYLPWELRSIVGESHMMAAAEARGMWQRTAAKCHMVHEDTIRSPKVVNCSLPRIISRSQTDSCHPMGYSYYWSNSCFSPETRLDAQGQFSPSRHRDYHSELDESLHARFSKPAGLQSLAAESTSVMKSGPGFFSATSDYSTAELELEWQFIIDPHPQSGLAIPMCELCKEEEDVTFEEAVWCDAKHDGPERLQQKRPFEPGTSDVITKSNYDTGSHGSHCGGFFSRQQLFASNVGAVFQETSENQDKSSTSSIKSILWQGTDKEILQCLGNCNLPCPPGSPTTKAATTSFDYSPSIEKQEDVLQNPDKKPFSSQPCGSESKHLENTGRLAFSPSWGSLDPDPAEAWHSERLSDPRTIPSMNGFSIRPGLQSFSSSNRNSQFNGGASVTMDQDSGLFAEALCHSQTRAREAERKVQRAFEEKERLMHLFFKEAYLAFTYRQWVSSLQSENMWLRMSPRNQPVAWLQHSVFNPFSALERLSSKHWKSFGQYNYHAGYPRDQNLIGVWHEKPLVYLGDPNEIMMGYTLAFALGLSLAGAGLVLGWSMGWILLSY